MDPRHGHRGTESETCRHADVGPRPPYVRSGVDVQAISTFRGFDPEVDRRIKRRVFTDAERAYCDDTRHPAQHYAARWAAKEAFVKLVGGPHDFAYDSVGVVAGDSGPRLALDGAATDALRETFDDVPGETVHDLSLSHDRDGDVAIAQLVAHGGVTEP